MNRINAGGYDRQWIRDAQEYLVPGTTTLEPGQAVSFVAKPGQDISANISTPAANLAAAYARPITMIPGLPGNDNYYLDAGMKITALASTNNTDVVTETQNSRTITYSDIFTGYRAPRGGYMRSFADWGDYDQETGNGPYDQLFLSSGGATLHQVVLDPYAWIASDADLGGSYTVGHVIEMPSGVTTQLQDFQTVVALYGSSKLLPVHYGFRRVLLDDAAATGDRANARPTARNTDANPSVNMNFRASRLTRHPFDAAVLSRYNNTFGSSQWTTDFALDPFDPSRFPNLATKSRPFLDPLNAPDADRFAIADVPHARIGILSLGELQNASLAQVGWASGLAFGNSLLPPDDADLPAGKSLSSRSGYSSDEENTIWGAMIPGAPPTALDKYLRRTDRLPGQLALFDWSFELNHALWDGFFFSGIPSGNPGWTAPAWDLKGVAVETAARDSRYVPAGVSVPSGGYFASDNFRACRVAYTLLRAGAFNVNSTSVAAWQSLLSAFRGVVVSTRGATNAPTTTPYPRFVTPLAGPVAPGSATPYYDRETWGGFRALGDEEILTLAQKIVTEVKRRGPFLSLSDFVNRRLMAADYSDWTAKENDHFGALQAAIDEAGINRAFDNPAGPLNLDRTKKDATDVKKRIVSAPFRLRPPPGLLRSPPAMLLRLLAAVASAGFVTSGFAADNAGKPAPAKDGGTVRLLCVAPTAPPLYKETSPGVMTAIPLPFGAQPPDNVFAKRGPAYGPVPFFTGGISPAHPVSGDGGRVDGYWFKAGDGADSGKHGPVKPARSGGGPDRWLLLAKSPPADGKSYLVCLFQPSVKTAWYPPKSLTIDLSRESFPDGDCLVLNLADKPVRFQAGKGATPVALKSGETVLAGLRPGAAVPVAFKVAVEDRAGLRLVFDRDGEIPAGRRGVLVVYPAYPQVSALPVSVRFFTLENARSRTRKKPRETARRSGRSRAKRKKRRHRIPVTPSSCPFGLRTGRGRRR